MKKFLLMFLLVGLMVAGLSTNIMNEVLDFPAVVEAAGTATTASGKWGNLTWTLDNEGTLVISGKGKMDDFCYKDGSWSSDFSDAWLDYRTDIKNIKICTGVTNIGNHAFPDCTNLRSVEIQNGVTSIGEGAFEGCSLLKSIEIPDSVTYIGFQAFVFCSNLMNIEIPNSVISIDEYAFAYCFRLENIIIPDKVTIINKGVFLSCSSLTNVVMPNGVTDIGTNAFYGCSSLTNINIPNGVTNIWHDVFSECTNLKTIEIPDSVTYIGEDAFPTDTILICSKDSWTMNSSDYKNQCKEKEDSGNTDTTIMASGKWGDLIWKLDMNGTLVISGKGEMDSFRIVNSEEAWRAYRDKIKKIQICNGVTSIGCWAFDGCYNLTCADISDDMTEINLGAFANCNSLTSIEIPKSVTRIGVQAFRDCKCMKDCYIFSEEDIKIASDSFSRDSIVIHGYEFLKEKISNCKDSDISFSDLCTEGRHAIVADSTLEPTCTEDGKTGGSHCKQCGTVIVAHNTIPAIGHKLSKRYELKATYKNKGNTEYYTCSACGKYFSDENGTNEIEKDSWILPKLKAKAQTIKVSSKASKNILYKASKLKMKKATFDISAKAKGKITYKVTTGKSKYITVSSKGKVTLKKGCKVGTYKVTVTAAETTNGEYKKATKVIIIKVK